MKENLRTLDATFALVEELNKQKIVCEHCGEIIDFDNIMWKELQEDRACLNCYRDRRPNES